MGIQDRDYYREDGGGFLATWARNGQVTKALIVINVVVFLVQLVTKLPGPRPNTGWLTDHFVLTGDGILHGEVWRLLTYGFLHSTDDVLHIIFNMLFLYWFGREMEEHYGQREFLAFYLVSILASGLLYLGSAYLGLNNTGMHTRVLGASGGVTAVMVLFAFHYPTRRVLLFGIIPMPIWLLVALYVGFNLFIMLAGQGEDGTRIAFAAHLGGAGFGAAYYLRQWRLTSWLPRLPTRLGRPRSRPSLRVYEDDPSQFEASPSDGVPVAPAGEEPLDSQVDAVLAKVARQGQGSLTAAERAVLQKASEVYRRRRK